MEKKILLGSKSGARIEKIHEKNPRPKNLVYCPFKESPIDCYHFQPNEYCLNSHFEWNLHTAWELLRISMASLDTLGYGHYAYKQDGLRFSLVSTYISCSM